MTKTPSKKTEYWTEMLEHISESWKRKKGRPYPFAGKDLKHLKQLRGWYTAAEVFALWSCYMVRSPFWGPKTGFLVDGLWAERSVLLDDPNFKPLVKKYEADLNLKTPEQVVLEFGL